MKIWKIYKYTQLDCLWVLYLKIADLYLSNHCRLAIFFWRASVNKFICAATLMRAFVAAVFRYSS